MANPFGGYQGLLAANQRAVQPGAGLLDMVRNSAAAQARLSPLDRIERRLAGAGMLNIPIASDVAGLGADVMGYLRRPETITPLNLSLSALGLIPFVPGMTVFHGSPHKFAPAEDNPLGAFDASRIGTGEGAQAFGHGLYLAETPGTARTYRMVGEQAVLPKWRIDGETFHTNTTMAGTGAGHKAASALERFDGDRALAIEWLHQETPLGPGYAQLRDDAVDLISNAQDITKDVGHLYEVDLPDEMIDRMLDWNKPLSEQPEGVREALESALSNDDVFQAWKKNGAIESINGSILYQRVAEQFGNYAGNMRGAGPQREAASSALREAGIPGIKYFDAAGGGRVTGEGTRNFVVFPGEERALKILRRE